MSYSGKERRNDYLNIESALQSFEESLREIKDAIPKMSAEIEMAKAHGKFIEAQVKDQTDHARKRVTQLLERIDNVENQLKECIHEEVGSIRQEYNDRLNHQGNKGGQSSLRQPLAAYQITVFCLCFGMLGAGISSVWATFMSHQDKEGHPVAMQKHAEAFAKQEAQNNVEELRTAYERKITDMQVGHVKELIEVKSNDRYYGTQAKDREKFVDAWQEIQDKDLTLLEERLEKKVMQAQQRRDDVLTH